MSKIRILPEHLANQIAAGEVVERPASVVKELIENSLDANANRIEVEIEGGGTRLIRVIDNGEGMDEDDVLLCLERHGTSKIRTAEDLAAISTLGFRGEAIPSIGSVSQLTIISRSNKSALGTKASLHFGKLLAVTETGCSRGSIFEVRNLFGQTPARRKFLRTARTELGHIEEVIKNYSLGNPQSTFLLTVDGRQTLYFESSLNMSERLAKILNHPNEFITISASGDTTAPYSLTGLLLPPEQGLAGPARLRLFVNNRAVKDRVLAHAVVEGMRGFLMKDKNPAGLIHLLLPADEVDVNVHPAKHEVRFRNAQTVHVFVVNAVHEAMKKEQQRLHLTLFGSNRQSPHEPVPVPAENQMVTSLRVEEEQAHWHLEKNEPPISSITRTQKHLTTGQVEPSHAFHAKSAPVAPVEKNVSADIADKRLQSAGVAERFQQRINPDPAISHGLRVIGTYADLYILCANEQGLLVIDQHAAHERLIYEEMRRQFLDQHLVSQHLLFPVTLELSLLQAELLEKHQEEIQRMGFAVQEFGGSSYVISAIPALAGRIEPRALLLDVLSQFGAEGSRKTAGVIDTILADLACKAAIKSGTLLAGKEIDDLLNRMARADLFSHCPHGRPVFRIFSQDEVKKWFFRT